MSRAVPQPLVARIGKMIPRLASDHQGEILATVAAIRRTLDAAGLDLNDLASCLAVDPVGEYATWRAPSAWSPPKSAAQPTASSKPKPEPPPNPTFSRVSHFARCEQLDIFAKSPVVALMNAADRAAFDALRKKIVTRPHEIVTRKEINLFNRLMASLWAVNMGRRKAAA